MQIPDALKAALWTAGFTFVALFATSAVGWMGDVIEWASSEGATDFPALGTLGYAAVSAVGAAASGLLNWVVRFAQERTGTGQVPTYGGGDA